VYSESSAGNSTLFKISSRRPNFDLITSISSSLFRGTDKNSTIAVVEDAETWYVDDYTILSIILPRFFLLTGKLKFEINLLPV
jgi:hypothetical protein